MSSGRIIWFSLVACALGCFTLAICNSEKAKRTADAIELTRNKPGLFVPDHGQWTHHARFVHRSGSMTLFLEDRGWTIDLASEEKSRRAASGKIYVASNAVPWRLR